ncbi:MAG: rhodanese-like domain-containing protein [Clostridiales bacterium]
MKRFYTLALFCLLALALSLLLGACGEEKTNEKNSYISINAEEAKEMMDEEASHILLDVRTQAEYDEGHIPGAILIPDTEIKDRAEEELADKEAVILVYCRSGRRSKVAAQALADLGYTGIYEFGGIIDWPYEIEVSE